MGKLIDIKGQRFGRLLVLDRSHHVFVNLSSGHRDTWWLCQCECGNEIDVRSRSLRCGDTTSCGCKQKEATINRNSKGPNKITVFSDHAEIELCNQYGRFTAVIDKDDVEKVSGFRWFKSVEGYVAKARPFCYLHRFLSPEVDRIKFKDGNKMNCRRRNIE
jgi:hypothetical protein